MNYFTIPEQEHEQYIYKRQQPVMAAAFPKWAKHFNEGHYLYVPCEPSVSVDYRPWWHPLALDIKEFTTGFPPPAIKWFEFTGQANTDKPNPIGSVLVHNGVVDLDLIREMVEAVRCKAVEQVRSYQEQEKQTEGYTIALTPAETSLVEAGKERCSCGHLDLFHGYHEDSSYCEVSGCQGCK